MGFKKAKEIRKSYKKKDKKIRRDTLKKEIREKKYYSYRNLGGHMLELDWFKFSRKDGEKKKKKKNKKRKKEIEYKLSKNHFI